MHGYKWPITSQSDGVIDSMPPVMKREFCLVMYNQLIQNVPLFRGLPQQVIAGLCEVSRNHLGVRNLETMHD